MTQQAKEPSQRETAEMIADILGETEHAPRDAIYGIVQLLGRFQSWRILSWAAQCHDEHGGLTMSNGQKMRVGSLFLHYANLFGQPKQWRLRQVQRIQESAGRQSDQ